MRYGKGGVYPDQAADDAAAGTGTGVTEGLSPNRWEFGGPCRDRTYDPLIKSQLLYQLS